jgi:glycosyltransferase involved in cell wall biosynthesis
MNILVLTTSYPSSTDDYKGRFVLDMVRALALRGHQVEVLTPHPGGTARHEELDGRVRVSRLRYRMGRADTLYGRFGVVETLKKQPWLVGQVPLSVARLAFESLTRARKTDLIISNWTLPCGVIGALAARKSGKPHIAVEHGGGLRLATSLPAGQSLVSFAARHTAVRHFVSEALLEEANRFLATDSSAAPAMVFPMPLLDLPTNHDRMYFPPLKVLFVGRLILGKGADIVLQAASRTRSIHVEVVGDGPERQRLQEFVLNEGLEGRVRFSGAVPHSHLSHCFARNDALVVPSFSRKGAITEGTPRVMLEGMASGLVPLVSRAGGMKEVVKHNLNGLLFEPGSPLDLAQCFKNLSNKPRQCAKLSRESTRTATKFTWDRLLHLWRSQVPGL